MEDGERVRAASTLAVLFGVLSCCWRARVLQGLALTAIMVAAGLYSAAPGWAGSTHSFSFSFGEFGTGAANMESPAGVAVNTSTNNVYVADAGNDRVDEYSSSGTLIRAWGWGVSDGSAALESCTVFCEAGLSGTGAGEFVHPTFIAVDNSPGPSAGDVYVGDPGDSLISKFTSEGALVASWGNHGTGETANGQLAGSHAAGKGTLASGSTTIEALTTSGGAFEPGQEIVGEHIPAETTILAVNGATLEISQPAEATSSNIPLTAHTAFAQLAGIALDAAGTLDVLDVEPHMLFKFEQSGNFIGDCATPRGSFPDGLAVNSTGDLFKVNSNGSVEELTPTCEDIGQITPQAVEGESATGLASEGTDLYVTDAGVVRHYVFVSQGVVSEPGGGSCTVAAFAPCPASDSFGMGNLSSADGIGVDGGFVYVADAGADEIDVFVLVLLATVLTGIATQITSDSATVEGTVDPEGVPVSECRFEYGTSTFYGQSVPCVEAVGSGHAAVTVHADISGLADSAGYHFRLRASNAQGTSFGADAAFSTFPAPTVTGLTVSGLTAGSVVLHALVDPEGTPASYHFEYGTSTGYGHSIPLAETPVGGGVTPVAVSAMLEGLTGNTTYHWRVVAHNENGTTLTPDHTFLYPENGAGTLPDDRAYELVTPPQKNGSLIGPSFTFAFPTDIADDGSRINLAVVQCFAEGTSCSGVRQRTGTIYSFSRSTSGWSATPLAPPATSFPLNTWWATSANDDTALFSMPTPPDGEDDFYARSPEGDFTDIGPIWPPSGGATTIRVFSVLSLAGTADLSHIVFLSKAFWPNSGGTPNAYALLEYAGAGNTQPVLVGVSGGAGSSELISACATKLGSSGEAGTPGNGAAVSEDGRTVYFTAEACGEGTGVVNSKANVPVGEVFARVDGAEGDAHTVSVSEPRASQVPGEPQEDCRSAACRRNTTLVSDWRRASFQGASSDGSKAFFTSAQQLTDGASEDEGSNLYLFDFDSPVGHRLIDVSAGDVSGVGPQVQGVMAFSNDGSHVYFIAKGVLSATANGEGQIPQAGGENLYVFERDAAHPEGHVAFIATLPVDAGFEDELGNHEANVTPDGRFLVFTSSGNLTPDATRGDGAQQVFRYDAESGVLTRVSVGEDGYNDNGNGGAGNGYIVPAFLSYDRLGAPRPDPTMSNDGSRVFFMSPVALTAGAVSSVPIGVSHSGGHEGERLYAENVYEWHEGQVSLISDGRDTSNGPSDTCSPNISSVCLLGVDASGANVFFTTADALVPADTDTQLDVYDARVCTQASPCISPAATPSLACSEEECHGSPSLSPPMLSPGSALFSGAGNPSPATQVKVAVKPTRAQLLAKALKVCRAKRNKHKRGVCEAQARKKYGPVHTARKSSRKAKAMKTSRRAG